MANTIFVLAFKNIYKIYIFHKTLKVKRSPAQAHAHAHTYSHTNTRLHLH